MRIPALATAFALLCSPVLAAERYVLDPEHVNIVWSANHLGFSDVSGKFAKVTGSFLLDEAKPQNGSVEVAVHTASVLTGLPDFDKHLRSADFFNAEKFPVATFKSTRVERTGEKTAKVMGNLTLLGVTKPVTLDVKLNKIGLNPRTNNKTAGFTAETVLKRSDFGMVYALPMVGDGVKLSLNAEGILENHLNRE